MNGALHSLTNRPLAVTAAFGLACLLTVSTAAPGFALGRPHVQGYYDQHAKEEGMEAQREYFENL